MARSKMPRRPTMLDTTRADAIIGGEDPVASTITAYTAVWAFMGVGDETFIDADVVRLRETVHTSGVDTTAHVWSRSSEFTLSGTLWCVYLLHGQYHRDPLLAAERYTEGSRAPIIQSLEAPVELRPLSPIMKEVDSLLRGDLTDDDLEYVLGEVSRVIRVLAADEAGTLWIGDPADPLAHYVTMRRSVLLVTAGELDAAARETAVDTLG